MISRLDLWKDTGYTESGVERPPIGASIRQPDFSYTELKPDKDELFNRVSLKAPYTDLMDVSYIRIYLDTANGDSKIIYGWVDSVTLRSDTEGYPLTDISWHVDPWRTWCTQAEFKTGLVRRRAISDNVPPQPYPYRFRTVGTTHDLVPNDGTWWALMNYITEDQQGIITNMTWAAIPVDANFNDFVYISAASTGQTVYKCPTLNMLLMGYFEELYELDPNAVISLCLSPIPPMEVSGSGTENDPYHTDPSTSHWNVDPTVTGSYGLFKAYGGSSGSRYFEYTASLPSELSTSDTLTWAVRDLTGSVVGALPWGLKVRNYTYRVVNSILTQYIQIRFNGTDSAPEGLSFTIPLPMISVTSNSWSSYVYSGQRDADIQARKLANIDAYERSVSGAWGTMGSTMGLGMMFGKTGSVATKKAMQGAGVSGIGSLLSGVIDYAYNEMWHNDMEQDLFDYTSAHQTDNILLPGDGEDFIYKGTCISLVALETDAYSRGVRNSDITLYGCHVTEPMASCQSLVEQGGPLQITNMTVGGDIPVEAKEYIRAMFSSGVRLI